ncbi:MAG: YraN family protein [Polyangiaceae bacterium]|nr:YraN family protein [Polyangiaceae bacterium]
MSAGSRARDDGRRAELAVADYLFARGFRILGRNVRLGRLELDVVARRGPLAVVVEVRTRAADAYVGALGSIDRAKRERLLRATEVLWASRPAAFRSVDRLRIDAAAVFFTGASTRIEYVEGAVTG